MLFWVAMVVLLVGSGSFLLCYWKTCRKRFQQSKCLCLGVLGKVAALSWPGLCAALSVPSLPAHSLSPKPAVFAEYRLGYLVQTFQPKMEQAGEYLAM